MAFMTMGISTLLLLAFALMCLIELSLDHSLPSGWKVTVRAVAPASPTDYGPLSTSCPKLLISRVFKPLWSEAAA
ncbi:hypothetical protein H920_04586 [Fukomys damarensis]|uniref:Secreted protein n=1 Tax=Fukomys damarensis TaxID=885580 RepID=A0A091DUH7_FUKDA|nr:hypothetical protein H920_04586 [Fukomys damarensis]